MKKKRFKAICTFFVIFFVSIQKTKPGPKSLQKDVSERESDISDVGWGSDSGQDQEETGEERKKGLEKVTTK